VTDDRLGFEEELAMGRTAKSAQGDRAGEREARIAKAKQRRLELDKDKEARDARIDQAVADVYLAQDERDEAAKVIEAADAKMGKAIVRILAEGVPMAQVAELTELSVNQVQKLKAATVEQTETAGGPGRPGGASQSIGTAAPKAAPAGPVPAAEPSRPETLASGPQCWLGLRVSEAGRMLGLRQCCGRRGGPMAAWPGEVAYQALLGAAGRGDGAAVPVEGRDGARVVMQLVERGRQWPGPRAFLAGGGAGPRHGRHRAPLRLRTGAWAGGAALHPGAGASV